MKTKTLLLALLVAFGEGVQAQPEAQKVTGLSDYFTFDINLSSILISCLLMLTAYAVWGRKKKRNRYTYYNSNSDSEMATYGNSNDSEVDRLRNRLNMLESEVSKLRQEIKALSVKIDSSKIPMEVIMPGAVEPETPRAQTSRPVKPAEPETSIHAFFLSTPNSDGSFNNSSANTSYKEGASIYKFQNIKGNRSKFRIDERDASVKLALAYPDKNIDPVCDATNAFDPRARKIFTEIPGEAELMGDKWMVITKARIRYES